MHHSPASQHAQHLVVRALFLPQAGGLADDYYAWRADVAAVPLLSDASRRSDFLAYAWARTWLPSALARAALFAAALAVLLAAAAMPLLILPALPVACALAFLLTPPPSRLLTAHTDAALLDGFIRSRSSCLPARCLLDDRVAAVLLAGEHATVREVCLHLAPSLDSSALHLRALARDLAAGA